MLVFVQHLKHASSKNSYVYRMQIINVYLFAIFTLNTKNLSQNIRDKREVKISFLLYTCHLLLLWDKTGFQYQPN